VKTVGFNPPDETWHAPGITGRMSSGSLMPTQKGWRERNAGPPRARRAFRLPAPRLFVCAVNSESSKSTICSS
jgi:hypothetical protein